MVSAGGVFLPWRGKVYVTVTVNSYRVCVPWAADWHWKQSCRLLWKYRYVLWIFSIWNLNDLNEYCTYIFVFYLILTYTSLMLVFSSCKHFQCYHISRLTKVLKGFKNFFYCLCRNGGCPCAVILKIQQQRYHFSFIKILKN